MNDEEYKINLNQLNVNTILFSEPYKGNIPETPMLIDPFTH